MYILIRILNQPLEVGTYVFVNALFYIGFDILVYTFVIVLRLMVNGCEWAWMTPLKLRVDNAKLCVFSN